jgi:hypothetical protein
MHARATVSRGKKTDRDGLLEVVENRLASQPADAGEVRKSLWVTDGGPVGCSPTLLYLGELCRGLR